MARLIHQSVAVFVLCYTLMIGIAQGEELAKFKVKNGGEFYDKYEMLVQGTDESGNQAKKYFRASEKTEVFDLKNKSHTYADAKKNGILPNNQLPKGIYILIEHNGDHAVKIRLLKE